MNDKELTIDQANRIAAGRVTVSVDPVDAELWRIEDADAVEAHEPMTQAAWRRFLTEWGGMGGVPVADALADALRETLSPHAIAGIVAYLQPARTNDPDANRQIDWFRQKLVETVGGKKELNRLCDEVGL